jgi:hypothetical protein
MDIADHGCAREGSIFACGGSMRIPQYATGICPARVEVEDIFGVARKNKIQVIL